jgi:hypothetical protein
MTEQQYCRTCPKPISHRSKGLCRSCAARLSGRTHGKAKPLATEQRQDKAKRRPTSSWWLVPRQAWGEALAKEEERMKASGASGALV